jgi:hypothetical protein
MDRGLHLFTLLAGLLFATAAAPAVAAPTLAYPNKNAHGRVDIVPPVMLRKLEDLNFGCLIATAAAGTAVMNPNNDVLTTTGGVLAAGCLSYAAQFEAVSPKKGVVIIRIPRNPITVTRSGGTETMTISNWTLEGNSNRVVAAQEPWAFRIGGTLNVKANQVEGLYTGTFDVDIQYP